LTCSDCGNVSRPTQIQPADVPSRTALTDVALSAKLGKHGCQT
jgi:hypothetical protein